MVRVAGGRQAVALPERDAVLQDLPRADALVGDDAASLRMLAGDSSVILPAALVRMPSRTSVSTAVLRARARSSATPNVPVT
jgi:hypothetical protein